MDIEQFYDADPRRRPSAEIELGEEWHDTHGTRYELNWIEDTGELYVMREPVPFMRADPFGGLHYSLGSSGRGADGKDMSVHVVAHIATLDEVHKILEGWTDQEETDGGANWLGDRLRTAGVLMGPDDPIDNVDVDVDVDPLDE